jgi:hypothetical protein
MRGEVPQIQHMMFICNSHFVRLGDPVDKRTQVILPTDTDQLAYVRCELQEFDGCMRRERQTRINSGSSEYSDRPVGRTCRARHL